MWRNISWNSTDSTLPEGMHRHEPGPYFKTPSIQSATSSQSAGTATAPTLSQATPVIVASSLALATPTQMSLSEDGGGGVADAGHSGGSFESQPSGSIALGVSEPRSSSMLELGSGGVGGGGGTPIHQDSSESIENKQRRQQQQQQKQQAKAAAKPANQQRRTRFKDTNRQSSQSGSAPNTRTSNNNNQQQQQQQQMSNSTTTTSGAHHQHHQGFRSRLSSISGALQHPKLARRLFPGHHEMSDQHHQQQPSTVQITTTSIDSPQHEQQQQHTSPMNNHHGQQTIEVEPRPLTGSSGRRLSQLFLPQQITQNSILDPYTSNDLIPPHLLGLYGQPPLVVGASGQASPGGHRASWADVSLFGRLANMRPSLDSGYQGTGQMRHSIDARK